MTSNERRRVVVTGLGAVTPFGADVATSWENLVAGAEDGPITAFDPSGYPQRFACELRGFDPENGSSPSRSGDWTGSRR